MTQCGRSGLARIDIEGIWADLIIRTGFFSSEHVTGFEYKQGFLPREAVY